MLCFSPTPSFWVVSDCSQVHAFLCLSFYVRLQAKGGDDSDSGVDGLFGSDDDDSDDESDDLADMAAKAKAKRDAEKKEFAANLHKRQPIGKSRIVFEIKPYDVETDLVALAAKVKALKVRPQLPFSESQHFPVCGGMCAFFPCSYGSLASALSVSAARG